MAKINILDSSVYNRIAAGEVVDRPYSVVKEFVENSIDAGATKISISIERGGKDLISVSDDGNGIGKEDLPAAFLPFGERLWRASVLLQGLLSGRVQEVRARRMKSAVRAELFRKFARVLSGTGRK